MIDKKDLDENIAELEATRKQTPSMCVLLASLYTIRDHLFGEEKEAERSYSLASAPAPVQIEAPSFAVSVSGNSDFLRAVSGKDGESAWEVIDGLMDTLKAVNPRVYENIMGKIRAL